MLAIPNFLYLLYAASEIITLQTSAVIRKFHQESVNLCDLFHSLSVLISFRILSQ